MENKRRFIRFRTSIVFLLIFSGIIWLVSSSMKSDVQTIKTIVIDAGHGGKDPGCHGSIANEKDVCLSIALQLGEFIKTTYPDIKVIYTRDKDVFVELDERAGIANRNKADLFICIHANSAGPTAYGAETYVLGLHRTEAQQKVAERENSTIYLESDKGEKYKGFDLSPDAIIARQLQLSVFLNHSISFAEKLQKEFKAIGRYDRGVRQAGFLVLYKTTMPSVLIETGFLTHSGDEKFLAGTEGQKKMAQSMFAAFEKYKAELEGVDQKTVGSDKKTEDSQKDINKSQNSDNSASTKKTNEPVTDAPIIFRVQIATSDTKIPITSQKFKGLDMFEYVQDGLYKYTTGVFENDFKGANEYKNIMRAQGFQHAFVVAFLNNERINLEKAIKLAEK